MTARGLMRAEEAPADAPYDARDLARNFERIALFVETEQAGRAPPDPRPIRKWRTEGEAVTWGINGSPGRGVTEQTIQYVQRISRVTGVPVRRVRSANDADLRIYMLDPEERRDLGVQLRERNIDNLPNLTAWIRGERVLCLGFFTGDEGEIKRAWVYIPKELTPALMRHCLHEEIAQSMGLTNDDNEVRPSIFNDRNEFAVLTRHDEDLLRILYDDRLRPGMTAEEARPLVPQIIKDLGLPTDPGPAPQRLSSPAPGS